MSLHEAPFSARALRRKAMADRTQTIVNLIAVGTPRAIIGQRLGIHLSTINAHVAMARATQILEPFSHEQRRLPRDLAVSLKAHAKLWAAAKARKEPFPEFVARLVAAASECIDAVLDD